MTVLIASAGVLLVSGPAQALTISSSPGGGAWINTGTWSGGVIPDGDDDVTISGGKSGFVKVSSKAGSAFYSTLNVAGTLSVSTTLYGGSVVNTGTITVTGGPFQNSGLSSSGTINLNTIGGIYTTGNVSLSGGSVNQDSSGSYRIDGTTSMQNISGPPRYALSAGTLDLNNSFTIDEGNFTQSGTGAVTIDNGDFSLNNQFAYYTMAGGTFTGNNGTLSLTSGSGLSGYGTFTSTGSGYSLNNSGSVVANGGTLDFSGFTEVTNSVDLNTQSLGWRATNTGKLILPTFAVDEGDNTYNWGEASGDTTIDRVNSIQLAFNGVTTGGDFSISLLAADNPDVPGGKGPDAKVAAVWDFDPPAGFTFTDVDLAFRYDDTVLASLGIPEASLKIYHNENGGWTNVTSSVDTANNIIYASGITSFSDFAAGSGFATPEPATVVSGLIGLLGLAGRRLIRRKRKI